MIVRDILEQIKDLDGNTEVYVCNDVDAALLWRMPWVHVIYTKKKLIKKEEVGYDLTVKLLKNEKIVGEIYQHRLKSDVGNAFHWRSLDEKITYLAEYAHTSRQTFLKVDCCSDEVIAELNGRTFTLG